MLHLRDPKFFKLLCRAAAIVLLMSLFSACSLRPPEGFPVEESIDVDRYMGSWYVIAHIPPGPTKNSYNSIERYYRGPDNEIQTVFTYRDGGFNGERKVMLPKGFVIEDTGGAVWGMRFFWPLKMQYLISYVDEDYQHTIVSREKLDWVWIMARQPEIDEATYNDLVQRVEKIGYDKENDYCISRSG
jgi:apolipoprotein D and lipocalin family protein